VRDDAARDASDLVGREARRVLAAGRVVRAADLAEPRLVARGQAVAMVYAGAGLEITTLGEALDHGSRGEIVRVVNPASRLVREAVVVGPGQVRVGGAGGATP
jgi:flagella basal body P-ring formation protein FlgA